MDRSELIEIIKLLKVIYPKENFKPEEWYSMYQKYPAEIVKQGIRNWYSGDWGFKAPTPRDIRDIMVGDRTVGAWDPDGVFMKAIERVRHEYERKQKTIQESLEEIRQ